MQKFWQCWALSTVLHFILLSYNFTYGQNWLVDHILPSDYDPNQVPIESTDTLLIVNNTIQLRSLSADQDQRSLHTDLILCREWRDYRVQDIAELQFNLSRSIHTVRVDLINRFWTPAVYFRNAISSNPVNTLQSNEYIIVTPQQKLVKLCSRLNVQFSCIFQLSNFPFDAQECFFELENTRNLQNVQLDMQFATTPPDTYQFRLHHFWNGSCVPDNFDKVAQTRKASCAFVAIRLVRHVNYYVIRYYLTTLLILMICYVQFWIPTIAWPGRLVFTVVVTLILLAVSHTAYDEVPAHDVVSLTWYIWFIQFFVYMALVEFATALAWVQFAQDKQRARLANTESPDGYYFGKKGMYHSCAMGVTYILHKLIGPIEFIENDEHYRNKVDYSARFLFPLVTLIFLITYILATVPKWAIVYR